ncbi:MAG TPA: RNA-binding protein [Myxococcota bacterium]|nr:RNA-binding protein [Myxococcota bacterium]
MEPQNKLYVGNFPFSWKEDDLEQAFSEYKDHIVDIKIIYDQFNGRSKGFAFITFDDDAVATKALEKADTPAGDRTLVVSPARPPVQRSSFERGDRDRGDRGGGGGRRGDRSDRGDGGFRRGGGRGFGS